MLVTVSLFVFVVFRRRDVAENLAAIFAAVVGSARLDDHGRAAVIALNREGDVGLLDVGIDDEAVVIERKARDIARGKRGADTVSRFVLAATEHRSKLRNRIQVVALHSRNQRFESLERTVSHPEHWRTVETEHRGDDADYQHCGNTVNCAENYHYYADRQANRGKQCPE